MYRLTLATLAVLLCKALLVNSGNVLVFPWEGSHWVNMKVMIKELHARGHEVTVIRPSNSWFIDEDSALYKTITIMSPGGFDLDLESFITRTLTMRRQGHSLWTLLSLVCDEMTQFYLIHKQIIDMMENFFEDTKLMQSLRDAKFDLVLTDPGTGGGVLLAHRLGLPLVYNVRWTIQGEGHQAIAPAPLSYVPIPRADLTDKMTFSQRVKNFMFFISSHIYIWFILDPNYKPFVSRYFGSDVHYMELFQAADIWLMRNDFTFEFPRPTMPNIVYISGFQCKPSKPLPQELEDFVQSSGEHGVIVMTLGTLVDKLPEDITEDIAAAFAELPQKVIWRYNGKKPSTLGNNTLLLD
ncbi:UDP-glucuronosyltransferase 2A2-like, partial [Nematolebias whitei]|uniref:UDP-glucuronosyltransferase 2A2-like n=1 Tax=Nematolebias whitei TaxID=451745 RepID=UPI00189B465A